MKNGVVVTRRSLQVEDEYHAVISFSIRYLVSEDRAGPEGSPITVIPGTAGFW